MLVFVETDLPWDPAYPINGVWYPVNIQQLWSDEELAEIGLARPAPAEPEALAPEPAD